MNDPRDERLERASAIFAHAAVFALASTLIELACTIGMATTEVEGIRIEPNVVRVGALLRFPLAFLIGALFGATSGPKAEAKTRFLLPSLFAAPWFLVEALEYRTLGTTGGMPRLSLLLSPAELFRFFFMIPPPPRATLSPSATPCRSGTGPAEGGVPVRVPSEAMDSQAGSPVPLKV